MLQISAELLSISSDAAVLVKNGKIIFANAGAYAVLGGDCVGKSIKTVFGDDIAHVQAGTFVSEITLNKKRYILRVCSSEGIKAMFLASERNDDTLINDAFIFSLRNYLMTMDVSLSLLRSRTELLPELQESLAVISRESYAINRILSNISIIRSSNSDELPFVPVALNLSDFLKKMLGSMMLGINNVDLRFSAPDEVNLYADPILLETLMCNLLSNCLIHAKGCSRISITISPGKDRVFISVDDDGCGIAPEEMHRVFDRYAHNYDLMNMGKGAGLGLTVVRTIAKKHGGTLLLESRSGSGTAVRVSLASNPYRKTALKQPEFIYQPDAKRLLTGLAGCLSAEFYSEKYLD